MATIKPQAVHAAPSAVGMNWTGRYGRTTPGTVR
jgi:hypothetical protein